MNKKYQIDTAENKAFLKEMRDGLLSFGHKFPSPGGGSYYLGDDGTPWTESVEVLHSSCQQIWKMQQ